MMAWVILGAVGFGIIGIIWLIEYLIEEKDW